MEWRQLRDISVNEIDSEIGQAGVIKVDLHQRTTDPASIDWSAPVEGQLFSKKLEQTFTREKLVGLLACNTTIYDDEIEDAIDRDLSIEALSSLRSKDRVNVDRYALAIRARRSIVACMLAYNPLGTKAQEEASNPQNNHPTAA